MSLRPWYEEYPGLLERELRAFEARGIIYSLNEAARDKHRIIAIELEYPRPPGPTAGGGCLRLRVVYPDSFPYFRPEVSTRDIRLLRHQSPFDGTLCLIGRTTVEWDPKQTVADYLAERLPLVTAAGVVTDPRELALREGEQAEPVTDYYSYKPGASILIDPPPSVVELAGTTHGTLTIGLRDSSVFSIRAAVLRIADTEGKVLAEMNSAIATGFPHRIHARWIRLERAPDPEDPFPAIRAARPNALRRPDQWRRFADGIVEIVATCFPEEVEPGQYGDGWLFVVLAKHEPKTPRRKRR